MSELKKTSTSRKMKPARIWRFAVQTSPTHSYVYIIPYWLRFLAPLITRWIERNAI